jgi:hypothetical protein
MTQENTVLSLNPDGHMLARQEAALRENGFEVISVSSPLQARFEIEMGRCGVFLTCDITPFAIYQDLASLFWSSCPDGSVVFVTRYPERNNPDADMILTDRDEPQSIVERIRAKKAKRAS